MAKAEADRDLRSELDTSEGWCCDGRTYKEHQHSSGECCQPKGKSIDELPEDGKKAARERVSKEGQSA